MSEKELSEVLMKQFDVKMYQARRLIHTEGNYIYNQARLRSWKDNGVEHYTLLAVRDSRTSAICRRIDGTIHLVSEARAIGKEGNFPPFHAWCRTVAVAYFGDALTGSSYDPYNKETFTIPQASTYDQEMRKRLDVPDYETMRKMLTHLHVDEESFDNFQKHHYKYSKLPDNLVDFQKLRRDEDAWKAFMDEFRERKRRMTFKFNTQKARKAVYKHFPQELYEPHEGDPDFYAEVKAERDANGKALSYFTLPPDEIQRIIHEKGNYDLAIEHYQIIDTGKNVGEAFDFISGQYVPTRHIQVQQRKEKETHAFPIYIKDTD